LDSPDYTLDLCTLVESILENPDIILRRQLDRIKDEKMAEMKMQGMEYDERMLELEQLEYPKPKREFIYETFNRFSDAHPWVGEENIRPKSIAREMYENFYSFADYIKQYDLQRAEGILLRYLSNFYKVIAQTVPDKHKTEAVRELELFFATMIRQVDSSLLDEWERMRDPNYVSPQKSEESSQPIEKPDITRNVKEFTQRIRIELFAFIRALIMQNFEEALILLNPSLDEENQEWNADRLEKILEAYYSNHERICLDPNARNIRHTYAKASEDGKTWKVQQILVDPQDQNDWMLDFQVNLEKARQEGKPSLQLNQFRAVSQL
jgi:hypothetical protein